MIMIAQWEYNIGKYFGHLEQKETENTNYI